VNTAGTHDATGLFLSLTPERVLDAVEAAGLRCNPVCHPLNSFENRVYEVELEDRSRIVAKFYRPGRWSRKQIQEEHEFMAELQAAEVPICGVRPFPDGPTLRRTEGIFYCLYDRRGGRAPEELNDEAAARLGMMSARIHNVGAGHDAPNRVRLSADSYVRDDLAWLLAHGTIPGSVEARFAAAVRTLADLADRLLSGVPVQRIHGDFHPGNILLLDGRFHALDFDDMVVGPPVQDLWLLLPGRDEHTRRLREIFLDAYEQLRAFDRSTLRLIEPLRGLRRVHYAAWLARRWHDPVFPVTWPHFGTEAYWSEETSDIEEIVAMIRADSPSPASPAAELEPPLSNKDLFWDWEEPK